MAKAFAALLALAVISLCVLSAASQQSTASLIMPARPFSAYSMDGEHFLPLGENQRFSARDGDLTLRMRLPDAYPVPYRMHLRLDHITASVAVNGRPVLETGLPGGGTDHSHCGSTWLHLDEDVLSLGDELTVTLHNPHPFGANADAYNTFLDHVYVANELRLNAQLIKMYAPIHWLGIAELALALMVFSISVAARLMGAHQNDAPCHIALIIFFHGALMLCAGELGRRSGNILRRMAAALGAVTAVLLVLPMLQAVLLYDAMALFRAALLALLIDRAGAGVSTGEAISCLWPDRPNDHNTATLMRMTAMRLMEALRKAGAAQIIGVGSREKWIIRDQVDCDLYRILDGEPQAMRRYAGEYLRGYWWAEETNAYLAQITGWCSAGES